MSDDVRSLQYRANNGDGWWRGRGISPPPHIRPQSRLIGVKKQNDDISVYSPPHLFPLWQKGRRGALLWNKVLTEEGLEDVIHLLQAVVQGSQLPPVVHPCDQNEGGFERRKKNCDSKPLGVVILRCLRELGNSYKGMLLS